MDRIAQLQREIAVQVERNITQATRWHIQGIMREISMEFDRLFPEQPFEDTARSYIYRGIE